jgi:hypothetical protein
LSPGTPENAFRLPVRTFKIDASVGRELTRQLADIAALSRDDGPLALAP